MLSRARVAAVVALLLLVLAGGCRKSPPPDEPAGRPSTTAPPTPAAPDALPADQTGGFDGAKAYQHVARIVGFGPRPPASEGSRRTQEYLRDQLASFGCAVEPDSFEASTPQGRVRMANVVGKAAGESGDVLLLLSHYDTKQLADAPGFVGANDGGSSTGVMLELARLLCRPAKKSKLSIWFAFLDGEEAFVEWGATDGTYGSRQLAATLALSGELKRVKAVVLADLVGDKELRFKRELNSTPWLTDMVWAAGRKLGYGEHFLDAQTSIEDDHIPFLRRDIPAVDLIDLDYAHWHTAHDTLDKVSARSLGVTGHVLLEVVAALEKKLK